MQMNNNNFNSTVAAFGAKNGAEFDGQTDEQLQSSPLDNNQISVPTNDGANGFEVSLPMLMSAAAAADQQSVQLRNRSLSSATADFCDGIGLRQQSPPPPTLKTTNALLFDYRGERVAGFQVGSSRRILCLPQIYELFLKQFVGGLHTVYTKLKRLGIQPLICSVEQVRALRNLGAIQSGVNRCKLIETDDFETLYRDCTNTGARPGRPLKRTISDNLRNCDSNTRQRHSDDAPVPCSSSSYCKDELSKRHSEDDFYAASKASTDRLLSSFIPSQQQHMLHQYLNDHQTTFDQNRNQQQQRQETSTSSSSSNTTITDNNNKPQPAQQQQQQNHHHMLLSIQQAIVAAAAMAATVQHQQQQQQQLRQQQQNGTNKGNAIVGDEQQKQQQRHMPLQQKVQIEVKEQLITVKEEKDENKNGGDDHEADSSPYSSGCSGSDTMPGAPPTLAIASFEEKGEQQQHQQRTAQRQRGGERDAVQIQCQANGATPHFLASSISPMRPLSLSSPSALGEERSRDSSTFGTNSSSSTGGGGGEERSGSEEGLSRGSGGADERAAQSGGSRRKHFKADRGSGRQSDAVEAESNDTSNGNSESPPTQSSPPSSGDGYCSFNSSDSYSSDRQQHHHMLNRLNMAVERVEKVLTDQCQHFHAIVNELKLARQCQERTMTRGRAEKRRSAEHLHQRHIRLERRQQVKTNSATTTTAKSKPTEEKEREATETDSK
ncbi:hypothetical protein niasHT_007508 [Heterodera trifolii]|uniref:SKI/SNO/DAC domain-containing protein n=1 Tax=Heterodera trifolii TaxID=157864 RepID=A0ABD2LPE2_9BILA